MSSLFIVFLNFSIFAGSRLAVGSSNTTTLALNDNAFAISTCTSEDIESPTIVGAQAANELLNIRGVKASFIMTEYQNQIFVSARSIDEINVQIIMEKMGGGGHLNTAGCQLSGISISEAIGILKATLDTMIEDGELVLE